MGEPYYQYRGRGEIGNPDSSMVENVQLGVSPADAEGDEEGSVCLELRSEQFPAGEVTLTPEQVAHLAEALDRFRHGDDGGEGGVVRSDGSVDDDGWDDLR